VVRGAEDGVIDPELVITADTVSVPSTVTEDGVYVNPVAVIASVQVPSSKEKTTTPEPLEVPEYD
jgi:hypothetical protein